MREERTGREREWRSGESPPRKVERNGLKEETDREDEGHHQGIKEDGEQNKEAWSPNLDNYHKHRNMRSH